jgi:hypothetical protein
MDDDIFMRRAYAQKELLKEDLSLRISEAINSAGALYEAMVFAPQRIIEEGNNEDLDKLKLMALHKKGIVKELLDKKIASIEVVKEERKVARVINPQMFGNFLIDFYKLWVESKDQLSNSHYKPDEVRQEIGDLFRDTSIGYSDPRRTLELFELYMKALSNSGIMDFRSKTFRAGKSWREGVS